MVREDILEKIKKLMALAEDQANVHEAASAAAMAQKLMEEHRVQEAELDLGSDEPEEIRSDTLGVEDGPSLREWRTNLGSVVCNANDCRFYLTPGHQWSGRLGRFKIVGRPGNIQTAQYMFMSLSLLILPLQNSFKFLKTSSLISLYFSSISVTSPPLLQCS